MEDTARIMAGSRVTYMSVTRQGSLFERDIYGIDKVGTPLKLGLSQV